MNEIYYYFLLFLIYSFIGWLIEVIGKLIEKHKFINRGFLIGPICPIYGHGCLLMILTLSRYKDNPLTLFIYAIFICSLLEYFTSYFMEKIFKARWWDYSQRKFNINGRICLGTIIPFGLLGLFIMYVSNPFLIEKLKLLPELWLNIIFWTILTMYVVDNIVSGVVVRSIKTADMSASKETDNTEEITKKVKEILQAKSILHRRLINAYPKLQAVKIKIKDQTEKIKKQKEEIEAQIEDKKREIIQKVNENVNKKSK